MARQLRLLFKHAIYFITNRGNYRFPIFESSGARWAFFQCVLEAARRFRWIVHGFVILNNHFHLVIETPEANLSEGMQWLETTFAVRFNRFRDERGHVFQGRFHAKLVEPGLSLARVMNYVHLNPVRAKLVSIQDLLLYPWSSLAQLLGSDRPECLACAAWLKEMGLEDSRDGWRNYQRLLVELDRSPKLQQESGFRCMTRGWAIGSKEWKSKVIAEFHEVPTLEAPFGPERDAIREAVWNQALENILARIGRSRSEARHARKGAPWKVAVAEELRCTTTATNRWIARELEMGAPSALRAYLSLARRARTAAGTEGIKR